MWPQDSRARIERIAATLSQAASIGSFLWVALPLLGPPAALLFAYLLGHSWIVAFAAGAIAMLLMLIVLFMYPLRATVRRIVYGFRYREVKITVDIDADGPKRHRRLSTFKARIVRTGTRHLPDRYCCPGPAADEDETSVAHAPEVVDGDARILGPLYDESDEHWNYQMDLGSSPGAGTDHQVKLAQRLDFRHVSYAPRLQRTILDPTDRLELVLRVPETSWPVNAEGQEMRVGNRSRALPIIVDETHHEVRLEVAKPRFASVYRIRWSPRIQLNRPFKIWPGANVLEQDRSADTTTSGAISSPKVT